DDERIEFLSLARRAGHELVDRCAFGGDFVVDPPRLKMFGDDTAPPTARLEDQNAFAGGPCGPRSCFAAPVDGERDGEGEDAPDADLTLDPDLAAHHVHEAFADGEAEAGAALAPERRPVYLREGLVESGDVGGSDADTAVVNGDAEDESRVGARGDPCVDEDL